MFNPRRFVSLAALCLSTSQAAEPRINSLRPDASLEEVVLLQHWVPPVYPADARKEKVGGTVNVRFIVDELGKVTSARVTEAPDPRLAEAALVAVKQWQVDPMVIDGKAIACCLDVPVVFSPNGRAAAARPEGSPPTDQLPQPAPTTPAKALTTPQGDYPPIMTDRKLSGAVLFSGTVMETGRVNAGVILQASHADFVLPALISLQKWEFTPSMQGDLPLRVAVEGEITFTKNEATVEEVLTANGITVPGGVTTELLPAIVASCDVVIPLDALLADEAGHATVEFTVTPEGRVKDVQLMEATHHDFGVSLTAAMESWIFGPQTDVMDGLGVGPRLRLREMRLKRTLAFEAASQMKGRQSAEYTRILDLLRDGKIQSAKGLDQKLSPIYRTVPRYPGAFVGRDAPAGKAVIDAVIDREGRVRFPKIVSATKDEFGWAAATAVAQWHFAPATRGGEPTEVKVRIPFDFAPPNE